MLTELIIQNNLQDKLGSARVTITHGEAARGLLPAIAPNPNCVIAVFESALHSEKPFSACIVNTRKNEHTAASRVKTISYMDNILAKQEAMSQGYDEAILLNTASNVADGSISNVFMVKDNQIFTPPVSDIANGDRFKIASVSPNQIVITNNQRTLNLDPKQPLHMDYAYATTVHSSQGLTADRVLIDAHAQSRTTAKDVFYVALSRARFEATVYTNNKDALPNAITRNNLKFAALDLSGKAYCR